MEIVTEYYTNKKALFSSVGKILRKHGFYSIETVTEEVDDYSEEKIKGYTLRYWFHEASVYRVIKGRDGIPFQFLHMPYELDDYKSTKPISLKKGNILVYETEYEDNVWFTCTTMLIGKKEMDSESAMGSTAYGSLSQMLQEGLIEKVLPVDHANAAPVEKPKPARNKRPAKKAPVTEVRSSIPPIENKPSVEEAQPVSYGVVDPVAETSMAEPVKDDLTLEEILMAAPIVEHVLAEVLKAKTIANDNPTTKEPPTTPIEDNPVLEEAPPEYGSFDTITKVFDMLKSTVEDISQITRFSSSKNKETGIRTLKVRRGYYHYNYGWRNNHYKEVPEMQLRGFWLEKAGFMRGDFIQVITIKDMMLLVPVRPPENWDE
jgi:hypothetical protein